METPKALLKFVAKAVLNAMGGGVLGDFAIEVLPDVARDVWAWWGKGRSPARMRAEVEALAQAPPSQVRDLAAEIVLEVAGHEPTEVRDRLEAYLNQLPLSIRQSLRRPADPAGRSVPADLVFGRPEDLLSFLPADLPRFKPGDRPLAGVDWELVELLGSGGFGEVWKARNPDFPTIPAVALKFCLDAEARDRLLRHEAAVLNQVMRQGRHPGIVALQHTYLTAEPPCLEYEYVEGGDLAGVLRDWHRRPPGPEIVDRASRLLLDLARTVAFAHRLNPPVVHRDLKPANVLVQQAADGGLLPRVADFGIGGLAAGRAIAQTRMASAAGVFLVTALRGAHTPLYASPQQMRGEPPDPRDDVHALGVIWYQLLTGNLGAGRPGGTRWAQRLADLGMAAALVQLLGSCVEEDPDDRPADAGELADRLAGLLAAMPRARRPAREEEDLAGQLARNLQGVSRAHDQARRLAEREHDYPAAARLLEEVPAHLRDAELYARVCRRRDRVAALEREVREAVQATRLDGLRPLVEELLGLQPERADLRRLLAALPDAEPEVPPDLPAVITNSIGMKLVLVPAGTFLMGSPETEADRAADEGPQHTVRITRPFYLGLHPVTQRQYEAVMRRNPAHFHKGNGGGPDHPVENVSWEDAVAFCRKLSTLAAEKKWRQAYRLPTEAEWEYACRAGSAAAFAFGEALSAEQANFDGRYPYGSAKAGPYLEKTTKVGRYPANGFGLFDAHGNVWEWCADWYAANGYGRTPERDPEGPDRGDRRVLRGGSWNNSGHQCRAARRNKYPPDFRNESIGFRVAWPALVRRKG
jgi:formylglycine-generating enzyme required for sulfatase activity/serine/threonine protein kinase